MNATQHNEDPQRLPGTARLVLQAARRRARLITLVTFTAAIVPAAACGGGKAPAGESSSPAIDVVTATVRRASLPDVYEAGGVMRARTTAVVTSRIMAPVLSVTAVPGDRVRAGQVLARLDDRDLGAGERRAGSAREAAVQAGRAAVADRDAAQAGLAMAAATERRITMLHARKSATDGELDQATAQLKEAQARLAGAESRVAEAAAGLAAATAGADAAGVTASWAAITAPFDGVVTEKLVEPGNMAIPGTPLFRIEQAGGMRLEVRLDESRAIRLRPDARITVGFDDPAGKTVAGRVAEVARAVEAGAHAFLVKIDLPDTGLPSGTFARARFEGDAREVLALPASAIVRRGQLTTAFVVDGDRARLRLVSLGTPQDDHVEVLAGLADGERVVVDPPANLVDGARIHGAPAAAGAR